MRVQVAIALGGICDAQCLPTLEALASDSDDRVRRFAAQSKSGSSHKADRPVWDDVAIETIQVSQ